MAIIESVVIGTGSNRLGEVVLSTTKGRTIARKYQSKVHNPHTPHQENQRNRMANCTMLYKALSGAISVGFANRDKLWSVYNAFSSKNIPVMDVTRYATVDGIIEDAIGPITISTGSLGTPEVSYVDSFMEINFTNIKDKFAAGDSVRMFGLNLSGNIALKQDYILKQSDLNAGTVHVAFSLAKQDAQYKCGAIMYKTSPKGSTNATLFDWINL
jgi:hypothetical protein